MSIQTAPYGEYEPRTEQEYDETDEPVWITDTGRRHWDRHAPAEACAPERAWDRGIPVEPDIWVCERARYHPETGMVLLASEGRVVAALRLRDTRPIERRSVERSVRERVLCGLERTLDVERCELVACGRIDLYDTSEDGEQESEYERESAGGVIYRGP